MIMTSQSHKSFPLGGKAAHVVGFDHAGLDKLRLVSGLEDTSPAHLAVDLPQSALGGME